MATITGTTGNDKLVGTMADDLLIANGGSDRLLGKGGADTYQLYFRSVQVGDSPYYKIDETNGGDSSIDTITGVGGLVQYGYGGVQNFAEISRTGVSGQHLVIKTAYKPHHYNSPGVETGTIKIINQYDPANPNAQIEKFMVGTVEYNLLNTNTGTAFNDIITGWDQEDTIYAGDGNDYISGGSGIDYLYGEAGNDVMFGDRGADFMYGGLGADTMFGGKGNDKMFGGDAADRMDGGNGKDRIFGEDGNDTLSGGGGNDRLFGGDGNDTLNGGAGNDRLKGQSGADTYVISSIGGDHDTIIEAGNAIGNDVLQLTDFGSAAEAMHSIGLTVSGNDLVITYENTAFSPGEIGQVTIQDQFLSGRFAVEQIRFGTLATDPVYHIEMLKGDNHTYSVHNGPDAGGEDIVLGTSGDDQIYGGIGSDIMVGGGGADMFMFHDEEDNRGGADLILDFDLADDTLDFTEIKTANFNTFTITDNSYGNAVISSIYGSIELDGIAASEVTADIFTFL